MIQLKKRLVSVDEYHKMAEVGILTEEDRVELIGGEIINMSPIGSRHAACVKKITAILAPLMGNKGILGIQDPIFLNEHSEPEPDVSILKPSNDFYASEHPRSDDIYLVIEVSDSSYEYDRWYKLPLYAESQIQEVWLIHLEEKEIQIFKEPKGKEYKYMQTITIGGQLVIEALNLSIPADEIL